MAFPQKSACVAYYSFDGNSNDATGNGNNGTDTSIAYSAVGALLGQAATFAGSSEVLIADNTVFHFGTGSFSVSLWIKTTAVSFQQIWAGRNAGSGPQIYIMNTGKINTDGVGTGGSTSTASINSGSWTHVAVVWDRPNSLVRTYINGSADSTIALGATTATEAISKAWGFQLYVEGTGNFVGSLDECGWWNTVLSPTDVTSLYNGGAGVAFPSTGPNSGFFFAATR